MDSLLAEGRALHARGRVNEAFVRYQAALTLEANHADAQHLLGLSYAALGHRDAGVAFIRRAVNQRPLAPDYRINLATVLSQQGQLLEAVAELKAACALVPDDADAVLSLASLQVRTQLHREAEASYERAAELLPRRADIHQALAELRYERGALPEALASVERLQALSPAKAKALNLGFAVHRGSPARRAEPSLLNADASLDADTLARGVAARDLLVLDDFLDDPWAIRTEALALCAEQARAFPEANFPGLQTDAQPSQPVMQRMADALGRSIRWSSPANGAFRISQAHDLARADVHIDSPTRQEIYGAVLYLSRPEDCAGGTSFFRHRGTGLESRPDQAQLRAGGYRSLLDFQERGLPTPQRLPFDEWRERRDATWRWMFEVPMRFNRLIVYRSDFFHAITGLFGDTLEQGRLVRLFHFEGLPTT